MSFVLFLHSALRWLILLFALLTIASGLRGMGGGRIFGKGDKRNALLLLICCDIQLLVGLALYFGNGWLNMMTTNAGEVMKNTAQRFYAMEHNVMMILAIVLVHIGYSSVKKSIPDQSKFKRLFWFTAIALVVILAAIPWPARELIGRPLFRGI
ncbi:MAG: hypothetical protein P4L41_16630 [Flavipsychrobacter sp.]|nr:hypothetical protein [Flavipsychrobacter sp.]